MCRLVICHTLPALSTALLLTVANAGSNSAKQSVIEVAHPGKSARAAAPLSSLVAHFRHFGLNRIGSSKTYG